MLREGISPFKDILYTDTHNHYVIEKVSKSFIKIGDQIIFADDLNEKTKIITVNYEKAQMQGFQIKKEFEQLKYRWFNFNTVSRNISHGQWQSIFLNEENPTDM